MLLKSAQLTLEKSHTAVHLITRGNLTIGDTPFVERVGTYSDSEVTVSHPFSVFLSTHAHSQLTAAVEVDQLMPVVYFEVGIGTMSVQMTAFGTFYLYIDGGESVIGHGKIERGDACGDCHIHLVWVDRGQIGALCRMLWHGCAREHRQADGDDEVYNRCWSSHDHAPLVEKLIVGFLVGVLESGIRRMGFELLWMEGQRAKLF